MAEQSFPAFNSAGVAPALSLNHTALFQLQRAAKWAKVVAVLGLIGLGLGIVIVIGFFFFIGSLNPVTAGFPEAQQGPGSQLRLVTGGFFGVIYTIIIILYLFPLLWLLRFGQRTQLALRTMDPDRLSDALRQLGRFFQFIGILIAIFMGMYLLLGVFMVIGMAALKTARDGGMH